MKKYLSGLLALVLAVSAFAFTTKSSSLSTSPNADPCSPASKKWFLITLDCNSQVQVGDVRNPLNYTVSNTAQVTELCQGSECVCAILACPTIIGGQTKPNITSTTSIYSNLYDYFYGGIISSAIAIKNQQNLRQAP
jgi:hypothetical protein